MIFENTQVKHKTFGSGNVVSTDGKYIKVKFESGSEKSFVYPDAFERFLTLSDGTVSDEILHDLAMANERKARILAAKNEENIHSMTHGIVIPGKEGIAESDDEDQAFKANQENE